MKTVTVVNRDGTPIEVSLAGPLNFHLRNSDGDCLRVWTEGEKANYLHFGVHSDPGDQDPSFFCFDLDDPEDCQTLSTFARALLLHLTAPKEESTEVAS